MAAYRDDVASIESRISRISWESRVSRENRVSRVSWERLCEHVYTEPSVSATDTRQ